MQHSDLLFLYLVVLCQLSLCSIVATLVHFISFPNSVVLYNFASIGISYGFLTWIEGECDYAHVHTHTLPMWVSVPSIAIPHTRMRAHSTDVGVPSSHSHVQYCRSLASQHISQ